MVVDAIISTSAQGFSTTFVDFRVAAYSGAASGFAYKTFGTRLDLGTEIG
jgi:hypothetical protein